MGLRLRYRPRPLPVFLRPEYLAKRRPTWRQLNDPHYRVKPFLDAVAELVAEMELREAKGLPPKKRMKLRFRPCT